MKNRFQILIALVLVLFFTACGGGDRYKKSPIDKLIVAMDTVQTYSIILADMDVEGTFSNTYKQKYKIIKPVNGIPTESKTGWEEVTERTFLKYESALGMTILSKTNGKLTRTISPAGYNNYIGNSQYGQWNNRSDGSSFWAFYGQYAFMRSMFNLGSYPARQSYWNDYRSNYYGRSRPYYGSASNGGRYYGTGGVTSKNSTSSWAKKSNSFQQRVRNRTSRSSSRSASGSSSYRSRGGGFGK